ncbi:MAG: methyltransferase domain-containing protein [Gammaproteobacteria bacterium]|nr:methyltransferase domain-containing protein [Gammaproteobacteria bacterium]
MEEDRKIDVEAEFYQGRIVHRQSDELGEVCVIDFGQQRVMRFDDGFGQSRKDLFRPASLVYEYMRAMIIGQLYAPSNHATVLGLGGGALVRALRKLFPAMSISAVEYRQLVADIASEYFGLPKDARFALYVADAMDYLNTQADESTDVIYSDMYHAHTEAGIQSQPDFLVACHRVLRPQGWLIINHHQLPEFGGQYYQQLTSTFNTIRLCTTGSDNHIIYAAKTKPVPSPESDKEKLQEFQKQLNCRLDELYLRVGEINRV